MKERLRYRYELATSDQYKYIRKEVLDYLVVNSLTIRDMDIPCMLRLISIIDGWVSDYEGYVANRKEEEN